MVTRHPGRLAETGAGWRSSAARARCLVLDTNVVLDLLVFDDPAVRVLHMALSEGSVRWLATAAMRGELLRVLAYPQLASRLSAGGPSERAPVDAAQARVDAVLARFDRLSQPVAAAEPAPVRCSDRDDQIFVDLAVAHGALLLSKDRQLLRLRRQLALLGVEVRAAALLLDGDAPASTIG